MANEEIYIISGYYEILFSRFKYYEIIFTQTELLLISMGESLKNWMISGDPGALRRDSLRRLSVSQLKKTYKDTLVFPLTDIEIISFKRGGLLKNPYLKIKTKKKTYEFYSKSKDNQESIEGFLASYTLS